MMGGKLTAEQVRECLQHVYYEGYNDGYVHRGHGIEETDWQAIADTLNATIEKICKPVEYKIGDNGFTLKPGVYDEYYGPFCVCSECSNFVPWVNYCMECGAKFEVVLSRDRW